MRRGWLPIFRLLMLVVFLVAASMLVGWLVACGLYGYLTPAMFLVAFLTWKLINVYRGIVKNLDFIFGAVRNNDFSFRFVDNPKQSSHAIINYSLNRIKEVLDEAKVKAADKEKYFETIIECANIGILILLDNGTVMKHNCKALNMLGIPVLGHIERLRPLSPVLADTLLSIAPKEQKSVCIATETGDVNLLFNCSSMQHEGRSLRVVSIENINRELDTQEGLAWEKLTRILTHEIMNSLAPVTSISNTLLHCNGDPAMVQQGLETIHCTSDRLMRFINSFRTVTRIPPPVKSAFYLLDFVNETVALIDFGPAKLAVNVQPADTMLYADRGQLSQVLVNMLKNSVEAVAAKKEKGCIEVSSRIADDERIYIEVSNNGGAIPAAVAENIFTPFFTTKNNGSGIGLAVSKQIIRLHGGTLYLAQNSNEKVSFIIIID